MKYCTGLCITYSVFLCADFEGFPQVWSHRSHS